MTKYTEINGFTVLEDNYDDYRNKYKLTGTFAAGMCLLFAQWLRENDLSDDTAEDVYNNTSAIRDGNRLDIHDNYNLTENGHYQISYLWGLENGIVYAEVYDAWNDRYIGNIEIVC